MSITFNSITNLHDEFLAPWLDLYETAFPPEERILTSVFWKILKAKEKGALSEAEMLAAIDVAQNRLVGIAFYEIQIEDSAANLWYLAVDSKLRSQGLGSHIYQEIVRRIQAANCQAMLFEVEIPENAHTPEIQRLAEQRIRFYRRNGAKLLSGIHYLQFVGSHQPLTPMHIMLHPFQAISAASAFSLANAVFDHTISQIGALSLE